MAAIPDFPSDVKILIHREREVEKEILYEDDEVVKESDMLGYEGSAKGNQGQKTKDNKRYKGHDRPITSL